MKAVAARGLTYGIIGTMAWAAVQFTPRIASNVAPSDPAALAAANKAIAASAVTTLNPVIVSIPESSVPELRFKPVIVNAQLLHGVDTIALSGTIHSSLVASLEHVA